MLHGSAPASTSAPLVLSSSAKKMVSPSLGIHHHERAREQGQQLRFTLAQSLGKIWRTTAGGIDMQIVTHCFKVKPTLSGLLENVDCRLRHKTRSESSSVGGTTGWARRKSASAVRANLRFIASRSGSSSVQGATPQHSLVYAASSGCNTLSGCCTSKTGILPSVVALLHFEKGVSGK